LAPFGNTAGNEYSALSICVKEKRPGYRNYTFNKNEIWTPRTHIAIEKYLYTAQPQDPHR
jgi:hypothetical protein